MSTNIKIDRPTNPKVESLLKKLSGSPVPVVYQLTRYKNPYKGKGASKAKGHRSVPLEGRFYHDGKEYRMVLNNQGIDIFDHEKLFDSEGRVRKHIRRPADASFKGGEMYLFPNRPDHMKIIEFMEWLPINGKEYVRLDRDAEAETTNDADYHLVRALSLVTSPNLTEDELKLKGRLFDLNTTMLTVTQIRAELSKKAKADPQAFVNRWNDPLSSVRIMCSELVSRQIVSFVQGSHGYCRIDEVGKPTKKPFLRIPAQDLDNHFDYFVKWLYNNDTEMEAFAEELNPTVKEPKTTTKKKK